MRECHGLVLGTAAALLIAAACTSVASACFCPVGDPSPTQSLAKVDAVFIGTVDEVVSAGSDQGEFVVTLSVQRSWKGVSVNTVEVRTPASRADCGYVDFLKGGEFLVYASTTRDGKLSTDLCTRTRFLTEAQDDLVELGPSSIVSTEVSTFGGMKGHFER